ncbi:efflux RND transporter periplasmic adaptor subunit [Marinobacter orientalis]|uniref:Efflux RND transporter periplasmic adaptor subunit n=1 Tax=Marinobacter orientalis TaxID=1928859 RepID=A0A7Y0RAS7_9GAMM|nr:efflux RND transporter periplasmic adaptor subunit [Marinobacter orientalis]NMT62218.1 efflux RND transporter periplasmic adaptor subunit [Marinobacter orientalis]TGX50934.1 efflux RND transporter periplasmic adaptor subunit [Marinobacter orientalis]
MNASRYRAIVSLAAVLILSVSGCKSSEPASDQGAAPITVRAAEVTGGQTEGVSLRFSGIVRAAQRATLTFQVSGTLRERAVELGQTVKTGDLLARVYNPALEPARDSAAARLEELRTQYDQAKREWERSRQLHERGVVSEQGLEQLASRRDSLKASMATAEASLAEATRLLQESELRAPFDGRVEALLVERDEFVASGQPVMRLSSPEGREVEVRVPAYMLSHVSLGQLLPVWSVQDRNHPPETGSIVEIAQSGGVRGELHPVLVSLPADTLEPGEPVEVGITPRETVATTVPLLAVMKSNGGASVFRVSDGTVRRVPVNVQRIIGERVVVDASDLTAGDRVVYAGMTRIADGDAVEVR